MPLTLRLGVTLLGCLSCLPACGALAPIPPSDAEEPGGTDTGIADASATPFVGACDAGPLSTPRCDFSQTCTPLTNVGCPVTPTPASGPMPTFGGGAIVDGTYVLTAIASYAGVSAGSPSRATIAFSAGTVQKVQETASECSVPSVIGTYAIDGANLTVTLTCPGPTTVKLPYTATPDRFVYRQDNEVWIFTRR
jgi:hypothetical protein